MLANYINLSKSIVIFSHPRSGSHWVQAMLPQLNLGELFFFDHAVANYDEHGISYDFWKNNGKQIDYDKELYVRSQILEFYQNKNIPVSIKINQFDNIYKLYPELQKFVNSYVILKRKDLDSSFWSLILAMHTGSWKSAPEGNIAITVKKTKLALSIKLMKDFIQMQNKLENDFFANVMYYEDILESSIDTQSNSEDKKFAKIGSKEKTIISNLQEVNLWLEEYQFQKLLNIWLIF
jgi:hypothetical protein